VSAVVFAVLVSGAGALGANADPIVDCNQNVDLTRQIKGCTDFIRSGKGLEGNLTIAYMNRGIAYGLKGQQAKALADFNTAVELSPDEAVPYYNRGNALFDLKRYPLAIADYTKAAEIDPDFALAYFNRGIAYEKVGDRENSRQDYLMVLQIDPESEAAKARLSRLEQPAGNKAKP
jgi:tetratricopeptide (TPR) repeat protein